MTMVLLGLCIVFGFTVAIGAVFTEGPQFLLEPPQWLDYTNSSGAIIECKSSGIPQPTIAWLDAIDNRVTDIPGLREVLANGSLRLLPYGSSQSRNDVHSTTYRCLATNSVGSILSRECKLRPELLPDYQCSVESDYTVEGNIGVLECRECGKSNRIKVVSWMRQNNPNEQQMVLTEGSKYAVTLDGSLHIANATLHDAQAAFYCQVAHVITGLRKISSGGKLFLTASEDKNSAPRMEYSQTTLNAKPGESVDLICVGYGTPPPSYRWFKEVNGALREVIVGGGILNLLGSILRFTSVTTHDQGQYVCLVSNIMGEVKKKLHLNVYLPLSVIIRPTVQVVDGGKDANFRCSFEGGIGGRNFGWLKDGQPIHDNSRIQVQPHSQMLIVRNVHRSDRGMYQCLVRTSDETEQATAQLVLGALPPELKTTFTEQTVQPGASVTFVCQASGSPSPKISWHTADHTIAPDEHYLISSVLDEMHDVVSSLSISRVKVEHGGYYTCVSENRLGKISHSQFLNVFGPPTARSPMNLTGVYHRDQVVHCPVAGYPITAVLWLHRGESLSSRHEVFNNGSLHLTNLDDTDDSGEYMCTAQNQQGKTATSYVYLKIMHPPEIQEFNFPTNLQEGNRAHISCTVISGDLPIEIKWLKDGYSMPHDSDVQENNHQFVSGLLFSCLSGRHSGFYTCVARNAAAETNFTSKLIVRVAPTWKQEPVDTKVLYRNSVFIDCLADGYPLPKITWSRSTGSTSARFIEPEPSNVIFHPNGTMIIHSATLQHKTHYTCEAENGIGNPIHKTIFLSVSVPSHFRIHHLNLTGVAGESMRLTCEAEGDPPQDIKWVRAPSNPTLPEPHIRYTSNGLISELELMRVGPDDAGEYQCIATNAFGSDTMVFLVAISEAPNAPPLVEVYDINSRWANAKWLSPEPTRSPATYFVVQFRERGLNKIWSNMTVTGYTINARIEALLPNSEYELHVFAANEVGVGPSSPIVTFKTLQEVPTVAPSDVTVEAREPETLFVKWTPLNGLIGEAEEIAGYHISTLETDTSEEIIKTVRGLNKQHIKIKGLKQWTKYTVTVRAYNHIGSGPESKHVKVITLEGYPDAAPSNVRCVGITSRSLKIEWEAPPLQLHNGRIIGYNVLFKKIIHPTVNGSPPVEVRKTDDLHELVYDLTPYSNYSIRISAYTFMGDGVQSKAIYCSTKEETPGPPDQVKAMVTSSGSVLLSWIDPVEPNGLIIKHNIYTQEGDKDVLSETLLGSRTLKHECRKLKENQDYEFWVTAITKVGEGIKSKGVIAKPLARAPARIASFSQTYIVGEGSTLTLECHGVGLPAPSKMWKDPAGRGYSEPKEHYKDVGNNMRLLSDNTLVIKPLFTYHAGNYTCFAKNVFGNDSIVYTVEVITAPDPPEIAILGAATYTIDVQWKVSLKDEPFITEIVIFYKGGKSEWARTVVETGHTHFKLTKLKCGTLYLISAQCFNDFGGSKNSSMIGINTTGGLPSVGPTIQDFFVINSSSVTIIFEAWMTKGCPISHFVVTYKPLNQVVWILVTEKLYPSDEYTISNLTPATKYKFLVTAFSDSGPSLSEYTFMTRDATGDSVPDDVDSLDSTLPSITAFVSTFLGCSFLAFISFTLYFHKSIFCGSNSESKVLVELDNRTNRTNHWSRSDSSSPEQDPALPVRKNVHHVETEIYASAEKAAPKRTYHHRSLDPYRFHDITVARSDDQDEPNCDVSPYATFNLPSQSARHPLKLKTFNRRGCYSSAPLSREQKRKSNSRHVSSATRPLEGLSLDRKQPRDDADVFSIHGEGAVAGTSFMSDSDSSEERHFRLPQTPHKTRTEAIVCKMDSSNESSEMSPDFGCKAMTGPNYSSRI